MEAAQESLKRVKISIHALREEGDATVTQQPRGTSIFLSTPSARRATGAVTTSVETLQEFLSTPSARRATDKMELDSKGNVFLSTPSARRATRWLRWTLSSP